MYEPPIHLLDLFQNFPYLAWKFSMRFDDLWDRLLNNRLGNAFGRLQHFGDERTTTKPVHQNFAAPIAEPSTFQDDDSALDLFEIRAARVRQLMAVFAGNEDAEERNSGNGPATL
ncbi:hypothetical protein ABZ319_19900 [Nocardia sp. NPDC005978]|uniref:hypothetical protein n=1 Tax=Nocardia sp. NPDC005978 TaxID=3156725 RepID=UPI0033B8C0F9